MYANPLVPSHTCIFCHKSFIRGYDLKRHQRTVHPQEEDPVNEDSEMDESMESDLSESEMSLSYTEGKDDGMEEEESSDAESSSDLEDNPTFQDWVEESKVYSNDMWNEKYKKYIAEGMSEKDAIEKSDTKIRWAVKRNFFARLKDFLTSYLHLRDDVTYQEVLEEIDEKMERGMDVHIAMNRVISKYKFKFNALFNRHDEDPVETSDDETND